MKTKILLITLWVAACLPSHAQQADSTWDLQKCIARALENNIKVQQNKLSNEVDQLSLDQSKASRYPSLNASVSQNFGWSKPLGTDNQYGNYESSNGTNYGLNSSVTLFNGFKTENRIKQSELAYNAGKYNTETVKEQISLNVLNAYLQVLYSNEQVKNSQKQVESTLEQLKLAEERQKLGLISKANYLQIKAQSANEKSTLANAEKSLIISKLNLKQLMELPASSNLEIQYPDFSSSINQNRQPNVDSVFAVAMETKPQIKSAALEVQNAALDEKIARAGYLPGLTLSGGLSTGYSSAFNGLDYTYQVQNRINPSIGLTLSIPIYQNKQIKTQVSKSKIGVQNAQLSELSARNELRKSIEQACADVVSAQISYQASYEGYTSASESFEVANEKSKNGMLSPVDFLIIKTNLITAESNLLQAKYNLIFSYKTLDYYSGTALTF